MNGHVIKKNIEFRVILTFKWNTYFQQNIKQLNRERKDFSTQDVEILMPKSEKKVPQIIIFTIFLSA